MCAFNVNARAFNDDPCAPLTSTRAPLTSTHKSLLRLYRPLVAASTVHSGVPLTSSTWKKRSLA
eukprot:3116372-Pyramimonas_sp.AAC.1